MCDTESALLAAVVAQPENMTHRLFLADYWYDHGQPEHAEFVRIQIELAADREDCSCSFNEPTCMACDRREPLRRRERELLNRHEFDFADPVSRFGWNANSTWVPSFEWAFRRGFVESITGTWADWQRHAAAIRAAHPLREVTLTTMPEAFTLNPSSAFERRATSDEIVGYLRLHYPGLTFHLPQGVGVGVPFDGAWPTVSIPSTTRSSEEPTMSTKPTVGPLIFAAGQVIQVPSPSPWTLQVVNRCFGKVVNRGDVQDEIDVAIRAAVAAECRRCAALLVAEAERLIVEGDEFDPLIADSLRRAAAAMLAG